MGLKENLQDLREQTGAGILDCQKALTEAGGDKEKAIKLLREKGLAKAAKKSARAATDGTIGAYIHPGGKIGVLVEVNCETDFVAKNEDFLAFARALAEVVAKENPADVATLSKLSVGGENVEARRQALVQKIGENITVRRLERLQAKGRLAQYVHGGKIGVLVDYEGAEEAGRDVAMHVSFAKPAYLTKAEVPAEVVERERGILAARAKESGKPEAIAAKMVEGGLNKFLAEQTLLGQPFIKDDKQTVEKMLAAKKSKVLGYRFLVVGEGIEKKKADLAAEVAAMTR
jgi:elongation factor Ts